MVAMRDQHLVHAPEQVICTLFLVPQHGNSYAAIVMGVGFEI